MQYLGLPISPILASNLDVIWWDSANGSLPGGVDWERIEISMPSLSGAPFVKVMRDTFPFLIFGLFVIALMTFVPQSWVWLVNITG